MLQCRNLRSAPTQREAPHAAAAETAGQPARDMKAEIGQLHRRQAQLQQELDCTHSHYQKLLESVAGPGWSRRMGPIERAMGLPDDNGQEDGSSHQATIKTARNNYSGEQSQDGGATASSLGVTRHDGGAVRSYYLFYVY